MLYVKMDFTIDPIKTNLVMDRHNLVGEIPTIKTCLKIKVQTKCQTEMATITKMETTPTKDAPTNTRTPHVSTVNNLDIFKPGASSK
jgi:hypothetical protein